MMIGRWSMRVTVPNTHSCRTTLFGLSHTLAIQGGNVCCYKHRQQSQSLANHAIPWHSDSNKRVQASSWLTQSMPMHVCRHKCFAPACYPQNNKNSAECRAGQHQQNSTSNLAT